MLMMFYSTIVTSVIAYESINRCQHRHDTHVIAKFIRSMSHSVKCSDLVGLLKSCSVVWALYHLAGMTPQARFSNEAMLQSLVCFFKHLSHDLRRSIMVHFHPFWSWKAQLPINHLHGNEPPSSKFLNLNSKRERKSNDLEQLEVE